VGSQKVVHLFLLISNLQTVFLSVGNVAVSNPWNLAANSLRSLLWSLPITRQSWRTGKTSKTAYQNETWPSLYTNIGIETSSETQGRIVGARESLNGQKNMAQKKSKERREEPLGTISYQTSSKRSPPFWLLIGARKLCDFPRTSPTPFLFFRFFFPPLSISNHSQLIERLELATIITVLNLTATTFSKDLAPF